MKYDLDRLAVETLTEKARTNYVWINGVYLPEEYKKIADAVENFEVRDDDVWVCSFQKSGKFFTSSLFPKFLCTAMLALTYPCMDSESYFKIN